MLNLGEVSENREVMRPEIRYRGYKLEAVVRFSGTRLMWKMHGGVWFEPPTGPSVPPIPVGLYIADPDLPAIEVTDHQNH